MPLGHAEYINHFFFFFKKKKKKFTSETWLEVETVTATGLYSQYQSTAIKAVDLQLRIKPRYQPASPRHNPLIRAGRGQTAKGQQRVAARKSKQTRGCQPKTFKRHTTH